MPKLIIWFSIDTFATVRSTVCKKTTEPFKFKSAITYCSNLTALIVLN